MGSGPGGSQAGGQNARHSHARTGTGGVLFSSRPAGDTGQARTAPAHGFKSSTDSNHSASGAARVRHNRPTQGARQGASLSPSRLFRTPASQQIVPHTGLGIQPPGDTGARQGAFLSPSIQLVTPDARHVQPFAEN